MTPVLQVRKRSLRGLAALPRATSRCHGEAWTVLLGPGASRT